MILPSDRFVWLEAGQGGDMKQKKPLHTAVRKPNAPPGKVFKNDGRRHVLDSILEREAEEVIANESARR